ncbi:monovalent cation/H+ antiporter subunit D [Rhodobacter calidifons]|uniref:Monovalent cation/H+ antiporter subunit D n=1 Tax=Rhodobacter calidifons TaxID=2715277 RepID=A0ABX0G354_9RHOB|nr:monovalent cation/H+ antiporter subunit D [Rhodobacter calidifons]NHB75299.1 monovalent cation/H+ antiporter subunit D [Rhodobacter calidifons]
MTGHWIILPVVLPAFVAGLMVTAMRNDLLLKRVTGVTSILLLNALALALLWSASTHGPQVYFLGDWPAPFGIVLVLDRLSAMMVLLLAALALAVVLYAIGSGWDAKGAHFHPLLQFLLMGIGGAFLTGDAFNLFVFFEILLIASYGLMIHGGGSARARAGLQYVAFNLIGSSLFLFALALTYSVTGTLNIADLAAKLPDLPQGDAAMLRVTAVLLILVFAIKGALVPLQFWLPGTYANAPGVVAAMFAVMTKVGAYATLRFGAMVFPPDLPATGTLISDLILPAGLVTLVIGAIGVLGASTLPRLVAFGGIASMGTAFIAIGAFTPATTAAALYYILHSTLATAAMFLVADLVIRRRAHARLTETAPPIAQAGLISALYMAAAIAMAGMPPLSGFLGKLLILDAFRAQAPLVWSVILLSSFLMILGFARAGSTLFWKPSAMEAAPDDRAPEGLAFTGTFGLLAGLVALTLLAGPVTGWLGATSESLYAPQGYIAAARLGQGG